MNNRSFKAINWAGWFFGGNALLFWLIGVRYLIQIAPLQLSVPNLFTEILAWSFLILAFTSHLALLIFLPGMALAVFCILFFSERILVGAVVLWATIAAMLLFFDTQIFALFRFHLNGAVLALVTSGEASQIFSFSGQEWLIASVLFIVLLLLEIGFARWLWRKQKSSKPLRHGKYYLGFIFGCLLLSYAMFLEASVYSSLSLAQQAFALPFYENVLSAILPVENSLHRMVMLGNANFAQLKQTNAPLNYPLHPLDIHAPKKPLNIVMIVIDTWRFDMMNAQVTPYIEKFAQQSWQFMDHFSGGNGTEPGIFSLFYGLPATYWTAMTEQHQSPVLMNTLLKQHYQMGIFASAELTAPSFNKNIFSAIKNLQITTPGNTPYARDQFITQEFQQFMNKKNASSPFFVFLFYDAAHGYCKPGDPVNLFKPEIKVCNHFALNNFSDPIPYRNRYQNALYYVDGLVGKVLSDLKDRGLLKNTIVLLTGDHGNEFNDNHLGYWEHASNYTRYQVQTPLIVYWPGKSPQHFHYLTSHYDIAPSLLTMALGCKNPPQDYSIGRSLLDSDAPQYLFVSSYINIGIREPDRITTFFPTGDDEIDDLTGRTIPGAKLRLNIVQQVFTDMKKYYY